MKLKSKPTIKGEKSPNIHHKKTRRKRLMAMSPLVMVGQKKQKTGSLRQELKTVFTPAR